MHAESAAFQQGLSNHYYPTSTDVLEAVRCKGPNPNPSLSLGQTDLQAASSDTKHEGLSQEDYCVLL